MTRLRRLEKQDNSGATT